MKKRGASGCDVFWDTALTALLKTARLGVPHERVLIQALVTTRLQVTVMERDAQQAGFRP